MEQQQNIIITDTLSGIGTEAYKGYLGHALCLDGMCRITFNGKELEMKRGDLMIVRQGRQLFPCDNDLYCCTIHRSMHTAMQLWYERTVGLVPKSHHAPY